LIQQEIKDPEVGFVSLSDVEVTRDLSHAKVFITVFDPEKAKESLKALRRASTFLRHRLGQELRLRHVPELHFVHDDSVERGSHIDDLITKALNADQVHHETTPAAVEDPDEE
jgi:ribosome-binding factor A